MRYDDETEETVIAGMGELHLEIIIDRLKYEFKVDAIVGEPAVAFRETITMEKEHRHKHSKQTGGKGQFADVWIEVSPLERGTGYVFAKEQDR